MTVLGWRSGQRRARQRRAVVKRASSRAHSKKAKGKSRSLTDIRDKGSRGWVRDDMVRAERMVRRCESATMGEATAGGG